VLSPSRADNQRGAHNETVPAKSSDGPRGEKRKAVTDENIDVGPSNPRGKKRKAVADENIDTSSDLPSRRVRNLPPHLKEIGYTAPKKGSRGAASGKRK
jgi:hypothetical protein